MVTLTLIQAKLPWGMEDYSAMFRASPAPHKNFQHALLHVSKAVGKLAPFIDRADHTENFTFPPEEVGKYVADLVICAARMANTNPGGSFDLGKAVLDRIESKMGVKLEP